MATKNKPFVLVIITAYGILFSNGLCDKTGLHCADSMYSFELPVKAVPDTDSILVGDSIKLLVNEPTLFKETTTGQMVDYSGAANLGSAIGFQKYDSASNNWVEAADLFSYTLTEGKRVTESKPGLYREFLFTEKDKRYLFNLTIVPARAGLFRIVFSNSGNTYRYDDPCTKAGFVINFKDTDHNRHLEGYTGNDVPGGDFYFHVGN